jgi:hypothetical protein
MFPLVTIQWKTICPETQFTVKQSPNVKDDSDMVTSAQCGLLGNTICPTYWHFRSQFCWTVINACHHLQLSNIISCHKLSLKGSYCYYCCSITAASLKHNNKNTQIATALHKPLPNFILYSHFISSSNSKCDSVTSVLQHAVIPLALEVVVLL